MAGSLDLRNRRLSADECAAFYGPQQFPIILASNGPADSTDETVEDLLQRDWHHAMPVTEIVSLNNEQVVELRDYVTDAEYPGIANAVLALGLSGEEEDAELIFQTLMYDITSSSGDIDFDVIDAKLNVPIALGYLANTTGAISPVFRLRESIESE